MKHLKKFETVTVYEDDREKYLSDIAFYLENILISKKCEGLRECLYSDYNYDNNKTVEYNFYFDSSNYTEESYEIFQNFLKEYKLGDCKEQYNKNNKIIYNTTLTDNQLEELHEKAEIHNSATKYNL